MAKNLTLGLLQRGDNLALCQGQLIITPKSGEPVPKDWLATNKTKIISEIAQQSQQSIYSYGYYQTGIYYDGRAPGIKVNFIDLLTGEYTYAAFNAELKRKRTTGNKKAGEPLPDGKFHVGTRSSFYMFWIKTSLDIPKRLSEWNKSMSKLKDVYFIAESFKKGKLANKTLTPLSLSEADVYQLFGDNLAISERQASDKTAIRTGDKKQRQEVAISTGDKDIYVDHTSNGLVPDSKCGVKQVRGGEGAGNLSAGAANQEQSNQGITYNVVPLTPIKKAPEEQSVDEWLQDYDSAS
ncbi:MAG: hypothetical protein ABJK64_11300 [Paraglaciecola sp.]|uniref:hypothetical protein n=1 Tax=Paraglaciecola sp. TaxID=1920173 RepID=UPI003298D2AE